MRARRPRAGPAADSVLVCIHVCVVSRARTATVRCASRFARTGRSGAAHSARQKQGFVKRSARRGWRAESLCALHARSSRVCARWAPHLRAEAASVACAPATRSLEHSRLSRGLLLRSAAWRSRRLPRCRRRCSGSCARCCFPARRRAALRRWLRGCAPSPTRSRPRRPLRRAKAAAQRRQRRRLLLRRRGRRRARLRRSAAWSALSTWPTIRRSS